MTLEEARKEIERLQSQTSDSSEAFAYHEALQILAKVKPDPEEEGRAVQDAEDDGVEWHVGSSWAIVNGHKIAVYCGDLVFPWVVLADGECGYVARSNPVTPPKSLAEARKSAIEAAKPESKSGPRRS